MFSLFQKKVSSENFMYIMKLEEACMQKCKNQYKRRKEISI